MTTMDDYIKQVVDRMPSGTPLRAQIAQELTALIGERLSRGQSMDEVRRQLGDPASFADSYLSAEPLVAAAFWPRAGAKIVDFTSSRRSWRWPLWWCVRAALARWATWELACRS